MGHGVVSGDGSRAIFAAAALDSLYPDPAGRLKLRGLDPEATYLVEPVFPGTTPAGLLPPEWWGRPTAAGQGGRFPLTILLTELKIEFSQ